MRIVHISDTHLGFRQYGLQEREEDFKKAFVDAFEKIAELRPDVVVHTGDLFDYSHPPTRALKTAMEVLSKFSHKGIPVFILPGTHDLPKTAGMTESPTTILAFINGVYDFGLTEGQNFTVKQKVDGKPLTLCGIPYSIDPLRLKEYITNMKAPKGTSILLFHEGLKEIFPEFEISIKDLPAGFDYYGIGHIHKRREFRHPKTSAPICFPGSTEITDFSDADQEKGFYLVEINKKKVDLEFVKLRAGRPFVDLPEIDCTDKDPEIIVTEAIQLIKKHTREGSVVRLNLAGKMALGKVGAINFIEIEKYATSEANLLYLEYNNQIEPIELKGQRIGEIKIEPPENEIKKFIKALPGYTKAQKQRYQKLAIDFIRKVAEAGR
jgi:DNA repair exonuclease SbcCD nuclease subunit